MKWKRSCGAAKGNPRGANREPHWIGPCEHSKGNGNGKHTYFPYVLSGQWVFDDEAAGLRQEALILGIDLMIEKATASIPDARKGFKLFFSPAPFPGYTVKLEWRRTEFGGNWYWCEQYGIEGWLCPAVSRYFDQAPRQIYARAEPK